MRSQWTDLKHLKVVDTMMARELLWPKVHHASQTHRDSCRQCPAAWMMKGSPKHTCDGPGQPEGEQDGDEVAADEGLGLDVKGVDIVDVHICLQRVDAPLCAIEQVWDAQNGLLLSLRQGRDTRLQEGGRKARPQEALQLLELQVPSTRRMSTWKPRLARIRS